MMPLPIEDYALIGDCQTAALVGKDGSIDWLCLPRFDSGACFAALLGAPEHGRWQIAPCSKVARVVRRYREDTLILETDMETAEGSIRVTDCMRLRSHQSPHLIRSVTGLAGEVPVHLELMIRFDYGSIVPWVRKLDDGSGISAIAGPDMIVLRTPIALEGKDHHTAADFTMRAGETFDFVMQWAPSDRDLPGAIDAQEAIGETQRFWQDWMSKAQLDGKWSSAVKRSLITLKALTHWETGGIVAAPTTSLPEQLGGPRNWDYRFCWLRDATFTLQALIGAGYHEEAAAWRSWLSRAIAGSPDDVQIMYGISGERRLTEWEVAWLPGYEGAKPVRIGNGAATQLQIDIYGEVLDAFFQATRAGLEHDELSWQLRETLLDHLETIWNQPDEGIWEVRGGKQDFVHSKVMAWVAFDRAVRSVEQHGRTGPVDRWRAIRDQIHEDVCTKGFDAKLNSFVQAYGSKQLDASLLLMALVGFLPPTDPRIIGTIAATEKYLLRDGFVRRYDTTADHDGLPGDEGSFLACSFWLADNYVLLNRFEEAERLFENLVSLCNDVGLLSEEYDSHAKRQVGNFPQAFSHVAMVNTAMNLRKIRGPTHDRASRNGEAHQG
jgi:GH15 family glucan-1,4-alpha-glucosidase